MNAPQFWENRASVISKVLQPLGSLYGYFVARRIRKAKPYQAPIPVICVGNISVGGTGKTPVCLALMELLKDKGFFFLSHGYQSEVKNVRVDLGVHSVFDIGDEATLFAMNAPTIVDNKRARGAQLAVKQGAKGIIMDDGFQHPYLIKTLSFVVVDGKKGFGNERIMPAGPLREPVLQGLKRADAIIIAGEDTWGVKFYLQRHQIDLPILTGHFEPNKEVINSLKGKKVFAFAGLGNPRKFFDMLEKQGVDVVGSKNFPDHNFYTRFDVEDIKRRAAGLPLVTTTKDIVKIPKELRKKMTVVDGRFIFDKPDQLNELLKGVLE